MSVFVLNGIYNTATCQERQNSKKFKNIKDFPRDFGQIQRFYPKTHKPTEPDRPPQQSVCKNGSFCSICKKLSENYDMQNSPWREQGLLAAQMVKYQRL